MNMRNDLIIDFETFGTNQVSCPIINCSVYTFNWERFVTKPYSFQEIVDGAVTFKLDVKYQVKNYNYVVEMEAVEFWENQEPETRRQALPTKDDISLEKFCNNFTKYLTKQPRINYWWSRNNSFDPIILWNAFRKAGDKMLLDQFIKHSYVRDTRSHIDAKFDYGQHNSFVPVSDTEYWNKTFKQHNSAHDIAADIMRLQTIHLVENEKEMPKR